MVQMSNLLPIFTNASEGPRVGFWLDKLWPKSVIGPKASATSGSICSIRCQAATLTFLVEVFFETTLETKEKRRMIKPTSIWNMILGEFLNHTLMLLLRRLVFFLLVLFF